MDNIDFGYIHALVNLSRIAFQEPSPVELSFRIDIELKNKAKCIKWASNGNVEVSCSSAGSSLDADDNGVTYNVHGLQMNQRTNYIDLNPKSLGEVVNSSLSIKVVSIQVAPVNTKKSDKNPVNVEETLFTVNTPFYNLLKSTDGKLNISGVNRAWSEFINEKVLADNCDLSIDLSLDNCLAEYILGCCYINFNDVQISNLPSAILLHLPVEKESKTNKKITPAEIKSKHLENIGKLVFNQDKYAVYSIQMNMSNEADSVLFNIFPRLESANFVLSYDFAAAYAIPDEEFKKEATDLWSMRFFNSSIGFIHRSNVREFSKNVNSLSNDSFTAQVSLCKTITAEGQLTEGTDPVIMKGVASLMPLTQADITSFETEFKLTLEIPPVEDTAKSGKASSKSSAKPTTVPIEQSSTEPAIGKIVMEISKPFLKSVVLPKQSTPINIESIRQTEPPIKLASNINPIEDLQDEIKKSLTRIASEYTAAFPNHLSNITNKNDRKTDFMQILHMKGTLSDIKTSLKPKMQQVLWWQYGPRGHALGRDHMRDLSSPPSLPLSSYSIKTGDIELDHMLADLFVMLTKQCNIVLNRMYKDTIIDENRASMDNHSEPETILDDVESTSQKLLRLLNQAESYEADHQYELAEQVHLERLHYFQSKVDGSAPIYEDYGSFCLRVSAKLFIQQEKVSAGIYYEKGCEAFRRSLLDSSQVTNDAIMLHLSCLMENLFTSDYTQSGKNKIIEDLFYSRLLGPQLGYDSSAQLSIDGYESDELLPINPMAYILLAIFYSLDKQLVKARRSLLLAAKAYAEMSCKPDVSTHGTPRRTLVLLLAQQSSYFAKYGFRRLLQESLSLAFSTENDVTKKIEARGLPSLTVPFIRYQLLYAQSLEFLISNPDEALLIADKCLHSADNDVDKIHGWLLLIRVHQALNAEMNLLLSLYMSALEVIEKSDSQIGYETLPLEDYLSLGKLLIQSNQYSTVVMILSNALRHYSSASSLFLYIGIAYLRMEQYHDADQMLQHANILDHRNPEVWAYYTLLCLYSSNNRVEEANSMLYQTLRLDLQNPSLLRELAICYIAIDKLAVAEDLIRRCLSYESSTNGKPSPMTRKLFADILAGQNRSSEALDEYKLVVESALDSSLQNQAIENYMKLANALGRNINNKTVEESMITPDEEQSRRVAASE